MTAVQQIDSKPLAIVDVDDCVCDFANVLIHTLNHYTGKNLMKHEFDDFHGITDMYGISYQQFTDYILWDELMLDAGVIPGSHDALARLVKDHQVIMLTARGYDKEAHKKTSEWMSEHDLYAHNIIIVPEGMTKSQCVKEFCGRAPAVIFDDGPHNATDLAKAYPEAQVFVPWQPWNAKLVGNWGYDNIHTVRSFRSGVSCYYADYVEGR